MIAFWGSVFRRHRPQTHRVSDSDGVLAENETEFGDGEHRRISKNLKGKESIDGYFYGNTGEAELQEISP
jgi:hypothetical protein